MAEGSNPASGKNIGPILRVGFLGLVAVQSVFGMSIELPGLFGDNPDFFGAAIDTAFFGYSARLLLAQAGIGMQKEAASKAAASLSGFECVMTLNIGREPGTWMPQEWASSGARLSLPLKMYFDNAEVDLGFPGEEALEGRYARRLRCDGGSFVGAQGEVKVQPTGGAWIAKATGQPGVSSLRFYVDFPEEARRNDVTLPAGRVFFSVQTMN